MEWLAGSQDLPGLVYVHKKRWKITMLLMGQLTISMAIFKSYVSLPETCWCVLRRVAEWVGKEVCWDDLR